MYRTHTCGQLRAANVNETVTLAGWVQKVRNLGAMTFIDLRDRYGITQIVVEEHSPADVKTVADGLGREYVLQVEGRVVERSSKNPKMPTGDIEVVASKLVVLHEAEVPPFTIEENSDGGDDLRMKYRFPVEISLNIPLEFRIFVPDFHFIIYIVLVSQRAVLFDINFITGSRINSQRTNHHQGTLRTSFLVQTEYGCIPFGISGIQSLFVHLFHGRG